MSDAASPPDDRIATGARRAETICDTAQRGVDHWLLKAVRLVRKCARQSIPEPEDIHRLRVAIRHTDAALITFGNVLPSQKCQRLRKRLRRLRRKAGYVRDVDVLLEHIAGYKASSARLNVEPAENLRENRRKLARQLQSAARHEIDDRLKRRARRITQRIRWRSPDPEPLTSDVASEFLGPVARSDLERLHRLRVCVKRLRYATGFLQAGLEESAAAELQAGLSALQQRLGEVCDHAASVRILEAELTTRHGADASGTLEALVDHERKRLAAGQSQFVAWWEQAGHAELQRAVNQCLE